LPFIEEIAKPWRKHLKLREVHGVEIVSGWSPASVVELGCGMGEFDAAFLKTCPSVRQYRAFDIAVPAVAKTRERISQVARPELDVDVRVSSVGDLDPEEFRNYDVLVGLGILPYLTDQGFEKLAAIGRRKNIYWTIIPRNRPFLMASISFTARSSAIRSTGCSPRPNSSSSWRLLGLRKSNSFGGARFVS